MTYRPGDYVYPADLPRRMLCRVAQTESAETPSGPLQVLTLEPLEGPWRESADALSVVRLGEDVRPASVRDLWRAEPAA
jgi:hypothetical protein